MKYIDIEFPLIMRMVPQRKEKTIIEGNPAGRSILVKQWMAANARGGMARIESKDGNVTIEAIEPETIDKPVTFKNGADSWVEKAFKPF